MDKRRRHKAKARRKLSRQIVRAGGRLAAAAERLMRSTRRLAGTRRGAAIGAAIGNSMVPGGYGVVIGALIGDRSAGRS
jgi:hypothetical protein